MTRTTATKNLIETTAAGYPQMTVEGHPGRYEIRNILTGAWRTIYTGRMGMAAEEAIKLIAFVAQVENLDEIRTELQQQERMAIIDLTEFGRRLQYVATMSQRNTCELADAIKRETRELAKIRTKLEAVRRMIEG